MASDLLLQRAYSTNPLRMATTHEPQRITLARPYGPLVVDVWEPRTPTDVAPILLIHGWGASGFYWHETAQNLAATARVIVPDLPGTGRSLPVRTPRNLFDLVAALLELLDALKLERVQVIGHSMGGALALLLADAQPARVERLVLTSTCFFLNEKQRQIYQTIMKFTFMTMRFRPTWLADLPGMTQLTATRYFYRVPKDTAMLRRGFLDYLQLDYATAVACANDASDPAIPATGTRLRVPVLLIACRQDQVMPVENVEYTANLIPDCTVRWIDECGHLPMVEKPEEYIEMLRDFLDV
jgi:pimeloyl-ACP methyl ester carboxylesterase